MLRAAIVISSLVIPGLAFGQCVTSTDLARGISAEFDDGSTSKYNSAESGSVFEFGADNAADPLEWFTTSYRGIFDEKVVERSPGSWTPVSDQTYDYDFDYKSLFPLSPGMIGGGVQVLVDDYGAEPATFSYSVFDRENVVIGDCSYGALDVYLTFLLPDLELGVTVLIYLPDVGIAYISESFWRDQDTLNRNLTRLAATN